MAHFLTRLVVFLKYPPAHSRLFLSRSHLILLLIPAPSCADVSDLQRGESGGRPSSLCSPELRQPWSSPAQSVCRWQPSLLRGEALAQELPLWSLWLVDYTLGCQLLTFLFSLSAAALWCYYKKKFCFFLLSFPFFRPTPFYLLFTVYFCFYLLIIIVIILLPIQRERRSSSTANRCPSQSPAVISHL